MKCGISVFLRCVPGFESGQSDVLVKVANQLFHSWQLNIVEVHFRKDGFELGSGLLELLQLFLALRRLRDVVKYLLLLL